MGLNRRTHTLYVSSGRRLSVVDTELCSARHPTGCAGPWPRARGGPGPSGIAIDPRSGTVYVGDQGVTAVVDGRRCNAEHVAGCGDQPALIPGIGGVDGLPVYLAVDPATRTLYDTDDQSRLLAIDVDRCNARTDSGCADQIEVIPARGGAMTYLALDPFVHALYVSEGVFGGTVALVDTKRCNADETAGCGLSRRSTMRSPTV